LAIGTEEATESEGPRATRKGDSSVRYIYQSTRENHSPKFGKGRARDSNLWREKVSAVGNNWVNDCLPGKIRVRANRREGGKKRIRKIFLK